MSVDEALKYVISMGVVSPRPSGKLAERWRLRPDAVPPQAANQ